MTFTQDKKAALEKYILDGMGKELGPMPINDDTMPDVKKALLKLLQQAHKEGMFKTPKWKVGVRIDPDDKTMVHIDVGEDSE